MTTTTHDLIAEKVTEAFLAPVREVGELLAREVDLLNARVDRHKESIDEILQRLETIEKRLTK